jgi:putative transposase
MTGPAFISLKPGSLVTANGRRYKITHRLHVDSVLAQDLETNAYEHLRVDLIRALPPDSADVSTEGPSDLNEITNEDWAIAQRRFEAIKPLLDDPFRTRAKAEQIAAAANVHTSTLYEWVRTFNASGHLSSLIPQKRGRKPGSRRLNSTAEAIIEAAITDVFLTKQRQRPQEVVNHVQLMCKNAGVEAPHPNTVRNRLRALPVASTLRSRGMREKARNQFDPILGNFPGADVPLAVVQIDHTEADVILVEEHTRLPMGRPFVTLAIDVFSRMVTGWFVSMEKPSAVAAGICLSRSMLPKRECLAELNVPGDWPVWGRIRAVHCDNAKEFRGAMLQRACQQYAIDLQMRPVKRPHYGGHIERLMGTSAGEIRKLPGATFSSPRERVGYDSEKESALTLPEFERHLVDFIVNIYHRRVHAELGVPPARQWEIGILGSRTRPSIGMPDIPGDPARIRLDFLPYVERTVQPYGILIDDIFYYHEVLSPWINATDPENPKAKRQFTVRRDPRDISLVFFFDPEANQYFPIPYRNAAHPPVSVWELRSAQKRLKDEGRAHVDESAIFEAVSRMRERVEASVTKTKAARRQLHRIRTTEKRASLASPRPAGPLLLPAAPFEGSRGTLASEDIFAIPVLPFDDLGVKP